MARKTLKDLRPSSPQREFGAFSQMLIEGMTDPKVQADKHAKSWCVVGIDTSMSALALTAIAFDDLTKRMTPVKWESVRWTVDDIDYLLRLQDAAMIHQNVIDVMPIGLPLNRVFIFQEEPVPLGMMNSGRAKFESGWVKQQCEISGAVLGSLMRWGFRNIEQVNNQKWRSTLKKEGVKIRTGPEGKFDIKEWAIQAFGLPELPDLVKSKSGSKIPRPEIGYGAKAKAVQPDDIYDAAAVMAYGIDTVQEMEAK
jgi:hypothetical protein